VKPLLLLISMFLITITPSVTAHGQESNAAHLVYTCGEVVCLYDRATGVSFPFEFFSARGSHQLDWSHDGRYVVVTDFNGPHTIYDVTTGRETLIPSSTEGMAWSPTNMYLISDHRASEAEIELHLIEWGERAPEIKGQILYRYEDTAAVVRNMWIVAIPYFCRVSKFQSCCRAYSTGLR